MENALIDLISKARRDYISDKGLSPDTLYLNDLMKEFAGKSIFGMTIKTSRNIDKNQMLIYNSTLAFLL